MAKINLKPVLRLLQICQLIYLQLKLLYTPFEILKSSIVLKNAAFQKLEYYHL